MGVAQVFNQVFKHEFKGVFRKVVLAFLKFSGADDKKEDAFMFHFIDNTDPPAHLAASMASDAAFTMQAPHNTGTRTRCRYRKKCKFLQSGNCHFFHPASEKNQALKNKPRLPRCRDKGQCRFLPNGNCRFFHTDAEKKQTVNNK